MTVLQAAFARLRLQRPAPPLQDRAEIDRLYPYWRRRVMAASVVGYATFYLVRANISIAADAIMGQYHISKTEWGVMLTIGTLVYSWSKFLSGVVGDQANPRYLLGLGLLGAALASFAFGFGAGVACFTLCWALNSLFQGTGVAPCVRLLTNWYSPKEIGRAWGIWNSSHQIGGGTILLAGGYLVTRFGWRSAFWVPAGFAVLVSLWLMNRLTDSPESHGLPPVEVYRGETLAPAIRKSSESFWAIFRAHIAGNPWVWVVSVANFFVYVVRWGILYWAPTYLIEAKSFDTLHASFSSSAFEYAGIFGAYAAGWLSDRATRGRRGPVSVAFMVLLIGFLLLLVTVPQGRVLEMTLIFIALGFLVYGPQMLVAVAAADFATKTASSTAVGLTGLFGYLGASVCGVATGWLVDHYGWNGAIWFYAGSAAVGALLLATTWARAAAVLQPED
ncbi:MAG TPA: MFS transporter [Opitutaceae bacterium]|nr:MFS transporter [Opitutaceae bacterium]